MAKAIYAKDEFGQKAIRGKILAANLHFYADGVLKRACDIPEGSYPAQPNNVVAWWPRVVKTLNSKDLYRLLRKVREPDKEIQFTLNDDKGVKEGRGSNENKFTWTIKVDPSWGFKIEEVRVEMFVRTIAHQQLSALKAKAEGREWRKGGMPANVVETTEHGGFFIEGDFD